MLNTNERHDAEGREFVFPIYDDDGDLVKAIPVLDSERSIDGGTFIDCINEAVETHHSRGIYSLVLMKDEQRGDEIITITKSTMADARVAVNLHYNDIRGIFPDMPSVVMKELGG